MFDAKNLRAGGPAHFFNRVALKAADTQYSRRSHDGQGGFQYLHSNLQFALVVSELEPQRTLMRRYRPVLAFFRVKRHEVVAVIPVAIPQAAVTDSVTVPR